MTNQVSNEHLIVLCDLKVEGERGRVFAEYSIIGALSATDWKDAPKILVREEDVQIGKSNDSQSISTFNS